MSHKNWRSQGRKRKKSSRKQLAAVIIVMLVLSFFCIARFCVSYIRTNVRNTTIQIVSELTRSKSLILSSILDETARDINNLACALDSAKDEEAGLRILDTFQESHELEALIVLDGEGNFLYGEDSSLVLKDVPADYMAQVKSEGFAISDTLIGADGEQEILFGIRISGGGVIYGALSVQSLQEACGENTYLGHGYSYVLERDGDIIIPPIHYSYEQIYGNIRELLTDSGNEEAVVARFMEALSDGRSGSVVFTINGQPQILCFDPVETEKKWQFVTVVPLDVAERDGARIIQATVYMAAMIIGLIAAAMTAGILFYLSIQRRQRKHDRFLIDIYQAISENTDTVIFILNSQNIRPDYVFENSERILGIPAEIFLNRGACEADEGTFYEELQALLTEQWPEEGCQREVHTYNDRLHRDMWLRILICPFRLGEEPKCIYAITDVTKEHNDREKIEAAVVAAQQANAAKSSFFSNMSHDMRTPMNGIVGMTAIAIRNLDNRDRVLDCLNKIDFSSKHLLSLINDVLDMSKIENGKLALSSEPLNLSEMLFELESMLKSQCDDRQQTLKFILRINHMCILGDALRLKQIFMNLLSNAVKFTSQGGTVTLTAVEEQHNQDHSTYHFEVSDNGIGMSPEFQDVVFNPFERSGDNTVHQTEGTGLGLAITKTLVSAMGGQITVKSELGQGTTFYVDLELPVQKTDCVERPAYEGFQLSADSFIGKRFLLAEDNAINQEIAVEILGAYGAMIEVADDGRQALECFIKSAPGYYDAILMDIQMPVMNGYEAARAIRSCSHSQAGSIPIIAMTANVFAEDILAARNAGMDDHIAKPLDLKLLYQVLQKYMP